VKFIINDVAMNVQERMLRAFLDFVILRLLLEDSLTAYEIDNIILDKFGSRRSPNTIYTKLSSMERNELITCNCTKRGRNYTITSKGKKAVTNSSNIIDTIQKMVPIIFGTIHS
jgi:DNA-binding PadR family transcriptional regulator